MKKPKRLTRGAKVAIVSLSWGGLGDANLIHKYHIAKSRLEIDFGLEVVTMPNALKGSEFIANHPELRAQDLMSAFEDTSVAAIFCAIGGDDTIRLLPYIDIDIIRNNPKIFMGYSDSTINHFIMYKAGLVSFYGPTVMCEFGEYVQIFDYTKQAVIDLLFKDSKNYLIQPSKDWSNDCVLWEEKNLNVSHKLQQDNHGYEVLQGNGVVTGHLLGGCAEVFIMAIGTSIWPSLEQWTGAVLFIETSEEKPSPNLMKWILRNLAAQGILKVLNGIIVGKPQGEVFYEEYKSVIKQVVADEEHLKDLTIFYNVNFGHSKPIGVIPYGIMTQLDCQSKSITLLESATIE